MEKRSGWTLSKKILEGVCLALLMGMVLLPILFWNRLPDQIPGHYNGAGEIDRWTGKMDLFVLPVSSFLLYFLLSAACAILRESIRKGEAPQAAYIGLTGVKLVLVGMFAVVEWHSALARPMAGWLRPAALVSGGVLMTGFLISCIRFAAGQGKK